MLSASRFHTHNAVSLALLLLCWIVLLSFVTARTNPPPRHCSLSVFLLSLAFVFLVIRKSVGFERAGLGLSLIRWRIPGDGQMLGGRSFELGCCESLRAQSS